LQRALAAFAKPAKHKVLFDSGWAMTETLNPTTSQTLRFEYVPRAGLFKLTVVNFLLSIITLTIYRFWAKTNVRKHIWSCVHINGEPLEYTGKGIELFKGALMVFGLFVLPYILLVKGLQLWLGEISPAVIGLQSLFALLIYLLWGFAVYKARKYQLSRTLWRGIRGTLAGSAMTYSLTFFGSMLAKGFSFGWATPVMNTVLQEQIIGDMRFGDAAFKFKGRAGPLYPTYALCWFLSIGVVIGGLVFFSVEIYNWFGPELTAAMDRVFHAENQPPPTKEDYWNFWSVFGVLVAALISFMLLIPMLWAIYTAKEMRRFANYTRFDGAQFKLNATTGGIIWLALVNLLLLVFTLGIAWPFIIQRNVRFLIDRLSLEGAIDIDRIQQSMAAVPTRGEGLADAFDIGAW
jgi:uncharacterized membrane protein YjgN (DUF898 family)